MVDIVRSYTKTGSPSESSIASGNANENVKGNENGSASASGKSVFPKKMTWND
jgi:hypothetical protein